MATPPPYSEPPPRYSRVADPNPMRYVVNNGHVYQVAEAPGPPQLYPLPQPLPPQQMYVPQPYIQPYPNPQYPQPFPPYNYTYPAPNHNIQPSPIQAPFYQPAYQPQPVYQSQPAAYQPPPQIIPAETFNYQEQPYVPPPPSEYITIPGTNFAIPREWMESSSKKKKKHKKIKKKKHVKRFLRALCGKQCMF